MGSVVRLLLDAAADPTVTNNANRSALVLAAEGGHADVHTLPPPHSPSRPYSPTPTLIYIGVELGVTFCFGCML